MKKITMITFIAFIMLLIAGCSHSPDDYDVSGERWQEFFSGTIKTRKVNLGYRGATKVTFIDDTVLEVPTQHFHNPGNIIEGHDGIIYKWESKCGCTKIYQWVSDENQTPASNGFIDYNSVNKIDELITKRLKEIMPDAVPTDSIQENPWESAYLRPPEIGETVMIELKDGTIALAYLNDRSEWKLNINKNKSSGGSSIVDVSKWKLIDLN